MSRPYTGEERSKYLTSNPMSPVSWIGPEMYIVGYVVRWVDG